MNAAVEGGMAYQDADDASDTESFSSDASDDSSAASPSRRKSWTPEAGSEVAEALRYLTCRPWLVSGRDDEMIATIRRNEEAIRAAFHRLGWVLVVERDLVRLRKSPPPRLDAWAAAGPDPRTCSWFFLLVAAAESMPPRAGLNQLVGAARSAAAEAGLPAPGDRPERLAIIAAMRLLDERGVIERLEGELDGFVQDENAPVLLAVHHTRLTHVIANPGVADPAADPETWLSQVTSDRDPARRMRRRLVDDTAVHAAELDEAEADWLSRRVRSGDGGPLAAAFGLALERRSEGAAFVVPDEAYRYPWELGPLPFPASGTVAHAALLVCDHTGSHGTLSGGPGAGWNGLSEDAVLDLIAEHAEANTAGKGGWSAELANDPQRLVTKVAELLEGLNLLRILPVTAADAPSDPATRTWWIAPAAGRWAMPPGAPKHPQPRQSRSGSVATGSSAALFDTEGEN